VDPRKSLFYCYGCGRGGDVIRFAELYHQVKFPRALSLLHQWRGLPSLLHEVAGFYRMQLDRHSEAVAYWGSARSPFAGTDRAHADRLRARRLLARLADTVGLSGPGSAASRSGDCLWLRYLQASRGGSAGREPVWPQPVCGGTSSSFLAGCQGWLVRMGPSAAISRSDSGRGSVRLRYEMLRRLADTTLRT
jgi:hypothetical protein